MTQPDQTPQEPAESAEATSSSAIDWRAALDRGARTVGRGLKETGIVVGTALVLSILLRTFVFQLFYVPSESMLETLQVGDKIVASKISMTLQGVQRGDVIVFHDPGDWLYAPVQQTGWRGTVTTALTNVGFLPSNSGEDLVKRVVGIAGDEVRCCSPDGRISVNGTVLDESAYTVTPTNQVEFNVTVPADHVFVMGDNRPNSRDSRFHLETAQGTVPLSEVRGVVVLKLWPLAHFGSVPAPDALVNLSK